MSASMRRTATLSPRANASLQGVAVIGFKNTQAGVEQLSLRHDDDVEPGGDFVSTEDLSNEPFRSVSLDGAAQLARGGDPQASDIERIRQDKHRSVAAVESDAVLVHILEVGAPPDPFVRP